MIIMDIAFIFGTREGKMRKYCKYPLSAHILISTRRYLTGRGSVTTSALRIFIHSVIR